MTIIRKINKPFHPPVIMNNTIINQVTEHKHLVLELSNDGSWQKHIDLITKKAFIRVNILRKFKFILDRKTLEKIYLTFIRPILEYADVVWDNKTLFLINKLEMFKQRLLESSLGELGQYLLIVYLKRRVGRRYRQDGKITTKYIFIKW